jgi:hypothetical protein
MRNALTSLALMTICLFIPARTPAQTKPATCADWLAVQSWAGTVTYSRSGGSSLSNGTSQTISEAPRSISRQQKATKAVMYGALQTGSYSRANTDGVPYE